MSDKPTDYQKDYSDDSFWEKCKKYAIKAGKDVIKLALKMHYAAQDADTPLWAKTTIYAALGYFIVPLDAIPDPTPVVGFADDLGVLTVALGTVAAHIKDEHLAMAKKKLQQWFG